MTSTSKTILWIVLIVILVIAGISAWALMGNNAPYPPQYPQPINVNTNTGQTPANTTGQVPGVPIASTKATTYVSQSSAVLNGQVNPNGVQTSYWYEYGPTESLGSTSGSQLIGGGYIAYSAPAGISGLRANTVYYYRIMAQNQYGKVSGAIANFKTTNTPPAPFTAPAAETVSASGVSQSAATLKGNVNPRGSTTYYWFEYGTSLALGSTTPADTVSGITNAVRSVAKNISGLAPNTTYYYRVDAQNGYGTVTGNILSFTTDPTTPVTKQGDSPTVSTSAATGITKDSATLHGQVNPNNSATTYNFEYGKSTLFGLFSLDQQTDTKSLTAGSKAVSVSANLSGLDSGSTYYYRAVATNQYGTTRGPVYSFTTK